MPAHPDVILVLCAVKLKCYSLFQSSQLLVAATFPPDTAIVLLTT